MDEEFEYIFKYLDINMRDFTYSNPEVNSTWNCPIEYYSCPGLQDIEAHIIYTHQRKMNDMTFIGTYLDIGTYLELKLGKYFTEIPVRNTYDNWDRYINKNKGNPPAHSSRFRDIESLFFYMAYPLL